jgi:hypothetical protein
MSLKTGNIKRNGSGVYYCVAGCSYQPYCAKTVDNKLVQRCCYADFLMTAEDPEHFEVICND